MAGMTQFYVQPLRWRPARSEEAHVEVTSADKHTHVVQTADGQLVHVRVDVPEPPEVNGSEIFRQLHAPPDADSQMWREVKNTLIQTAAMMAVVVATACVVHVVAGTFKHAA